MDKVMRDLFGDEPTVAPAMTPQTPPAATDAASASAAPKAELSDRETRGETKQKRKEFVARYSTGDPSEGFTTEEALTYLREMSAEMSPREFRRAMEQTLEHLSPSQREDFIKIMQEYKGSRPDAVASKQNAAGAASFGGILDGLMGGGRGGAGVGLDEIVADLQKGGLRGTADPDDQTVTESDFRDLLNSPLARAVLGGVAAYAIQDRPDE